MTPEVIEQAPDGTWRNVCADLLTTCPRCGLMDHHPLDVVPPAPNPVAGRKTHLMIESSSVPLQTLTEPDTLPGALIRTCLTCRHEWREPLR